ncbi:acyl-ACP--UDP-N-acetylglucosamine O-acyltransferase [Candidatus Babeliales bacterium]|nr:acyl-ACP--UDP-N-acetylglucosamine O-acyltransferase [Candidatus Babeliales bacterium]
MTKKENSFFEEEFFYSKKKYIHKTSIVGPDVIIENNVKIGPYCTIVGKVKIKSGTKIFPYVSIGLPAQDLDTTHSLGSIEIGENCIIREFVSIHSSKTENGFTAVGNNCYIMNYCHIAHDVIMEENIVLTNNTNLGGHSYLEKNVLLMANTAVHQFCKIGKYSCITPFSGTRQDLPPFSMFTGQPSHFSNLNLIALKRANFSKESINAVKRVTNLYYINKLPLQKIKDLANQESISWGNDQYVQEFLTFIENSKRGVSRRALFYETETYNKQVTI